ncbi:MAG: protein kinase [Calothrix sp. C42_A2020_038]|nr:protein kinase [Calothrix sp. C42_A2020_038]
MLLNNRYRVIQTLGSGGFGETFLAEDTQMPSKRRCVIKQLKPINNNPEMYQLVKERFQREAAILEELGDNSNQIPRLYAYFSENGQFYLVQEYIEGQTLNAKIQIHGAMSESMVRDILISILPVLDYVHGKGIVHRDIKPDNIIIRYSDGKPVLIDFGAVKETIGTVFTPSGNSTRSIVIGTPGFMPSEQSVGRPMFASDIYSLGMTAIYLLTGKLPQDIPNDPATGAILWRQYATNITPSFAMALDKAIQFVPQHRFNSAREMLSNLQSANSAFIPTTPYQSSTNNLPQQNTIPISPGGYQQPGNPGTTPIHQNNPRQIAYSSGKGIMVGALIGAGLIGGAIIVASTLGRQGEQVVQEPAPVTTTLNPQTPTPLPTQDDLQSEPPVISRPKRITPNPIPTREPEPEPEPTATFSELPTATQTPIETSEPLPLPSPTQTPQAPDVMIPTQPPTVEPSPNPPKPNQPSPTQFIQNYYNSVNNKDLEKTWNQLAPTYRNNRRIHPKGFDSYVGWWDRTVQQVEVNQINLVRDNGQTAVVDAQLNYLLRNGKQSLDSVRFTLVWDTATNQWLISDAR